MLRKTVLVPVVTLATGRGSGLLEIIVEPAGLGEGTVPQLQLLYSAGLGAAVAAAQAALAVSRLPPAAAGCVGHLLREPSVLYVANPKPQLSNSAGAALGVALGLLLHDGRCPGQRLIASGTLMLPGPLGLVAIGSEGDIAAKLETALALGLQALPLPFLVPAHTADGVETAQDCAELIATLAALNIRVLPVASLGEAVAACWQLDREIRFADASEKVSRS
jgi:hypothetical protein